jgi:proliferating cell nuclear antigen
MNDCENMKIEQKDDSIIYRGEFDSKYLLQFTKCTNLSNVIELYLKNDYPLIVQYAVGSLGSIKLCLAPQQPSED